MSHMIMTDVMEEKPPHPAQEGSVNRRGRPAEERPFSLSIMRYSGIRVMEVREHHYIKKAVRMTRNG